jgi:hypothetical protein
VDYGEFWISREEYTMPTDEELYESLVFSDAGRGPGYAAYYAGKLQFEADDWDEALQAARDWMKQENYYPSMYYVNERGNTELLDADGNVLAGWV